MSKLIAGIVGAAALACAAGVFYWAHGPAPMARIANSSQPKAASEDTETTAKPAARAPAASSGGMNNKNSATPTEAGTPLRAGEVLEFSADVANLTNVANLRLQIVERHDFFGKAAWHLQAFAHTENPLRMVFELDDQFDSYSDAATLSSLQYEMHLNERGQKLESIQRMTTTGVEHAPRNATETRVVPGTRDPLGWMQYLRTVDWSKTRELRGPVYDGHRLYDVRASYKGFAQNIAVPAGNFAASKIEIRVFDDGVELKDARFTLYLADDAARTPVLLEAVLPFATARVVLGKIK